MTDGWFKTLVFIISILLIIILTITVLILVKLYKLSNHAKHITEQAANIVDRADSVSSFFKKTAGPVALVKLISNIAEAINKKGSKK